MVIKINGKELNFDAPVKVYEAAEAAGLSGSGAVAGVFNGATVEFNHVLDKDGELSILDFSSDEGKAVLRHTAAHILAQAVKRIYPTVKLAIGPAVANGFYYDFDFKTPITQENFDAIEAEMRKIIKANYPIVKKTVSRAEALELMRASGEEYKVELIADLPEDAEISLYTQGEFTDLCAGPHLTSTGKVKAFKLTSLTGAYWRGSEKNKMLSRIYGTAFDSKPALDEYLEKLEEAKRRDHNRIGRDLEIFMTDENIGQGLPLLMPKGAKIMQILQRFVEDEEENRGYLLTKTPIMSKNNLFKISGHWDHYKDKMFVMGEEGKDDEVMALRPMTCPFQFTIYKNGLKSYRDLPVRYCETATLYRKEASGEMHGLTRVRQFTLSDGHIVCTEKQIEGEFKAALDIIKYFMKCLGIENDISYRFSKRDPKNASKYVGSDEVWEATESKMKSILDGIGLVYEEAEGEAAFYGPKLDIQAVNVHGKEDTLFTIQIDFSLAERFDMSYIDESGEKVRPTIIHRSSIGCYERTLAMLIEKYNGALPLWISPVQVRVMSLTGRTEKQVKKAVETLRKHGVRTEADVRSEKIGYKIREAQLEKIPYMLVIGDKDIEAKVVSVRDRAGNQVSMSLAAFVKQIKKEIKDMK
ncbi:MAG: threonine--tRNA ligase [Clostridiaceae bacterium]|jgi:threonyl-tRNA synthetase|nr:threonine--tRNA ligase [Clostridiaceae bacterium]